MAIIVTKTADNAYHIRDAFRSYNRDYYPMGVYEAIYDYIQETYGGDDVYDLDVIAWCCDISETSLSESADGDELYTLDDLVSTIADETSILYVDEDNEIVYHFAY